MWFVGEHSDAIRILDSIDFPENLVLNTYSDRLRKYFEKGIQ
jgi:hypothetical protein